MTALRHHVVEVHARFMIKSGALFTATISCGAQFWFARQAAIRLDGGMRTFYCCLALFLCFGPGLTAEPGKRNGRRHQESGSPTPVAIIHPADPPSANLTRFMQAHLAALSDITAAGGPASIAYRTDVSLLRAEFQAQATTAPSEKKSTYTAALRACDVLAAAIEEREKAAANYASAQSGPTTQDVKDVRLSTVRARHGYGKATRANNAKEAAANNQADSNAAFMDSASLKAWASRAAQLRQQIDSVYAQEVAIEQQASASSPIPAAASPP